MNTLEFRMLHRVQLIQNSRHKSLLHPVAKITISKIKNILIEVPTMVFIAFSLLCLFVRSVTADDIE